MDKNVNNNDKAFAVGVSINKLGYPKPYLYGVPFGFFFFFEDLFVRSPRKLLAKILVLPRYLSWVGGGGGCCLPCRLFFLLRFLFFFLPKIRKGGPGPLPLIRHWLVQTRSKFLIILQRSLKPEEIFPHTRTHLNKSDSYDYFQTQSSSQRTRFLSLS